jgi:hypothetical protein
MPFYLIGNMDPCGAVVLIMEKIMALHGRMQKRALKQD